MKHYFKFLFFVLLIASSCFAKTKNYQLPATVVTCSADNCPTISPILENNETLANQAIIYQTSQDKPEFMTRFTKVFSAQSNNGWQSILINQSQFQNTYPVIGFGGSFTDAAAILYQNLSKPLQKGLINAYFSPQGIYYSLGRVPIASHDFSCRARNDRNEGEPSLDRCVPDLSCYSYHDSPDEKLTHFALQAEDIKFKIPMIQDALKVQNNTRTPFKLYASVWSAPAWMKTNGNMVHGSLKRELQQTWANYFVKFLQAYKNRNVTFWGMTVQNEPEESGLQENFQTWQTMFYTMDEEANFIKNYLGPALANLEKEYGSKISLIMHDDQITTLDRLKMLFDREVLKYVDGVGLHWYTNNDLNYSNLDEADDILNTYSTPNKFIIGTEACEGYLPYDKGPKLGDWSRGESYAHDMISDLNHHVSGWTDWNLLLDMQGGPNWAKNYVDAPILADIKAQVLYLQPMYYYMGHFSKFIRPDSRLLDSTSRGPFPLEEVTYKVPGYDNMPATIVVVVLNRDHLQRYYYLKDLSKKSGETYLNMHIPPHAIQTIIYQAE